MYALPNKTQHKILVKVRGGISQKVDNLNSAQNSQASNNHLLNNKSISSVAETIFNRHIDDTGFSAELNNSPQPIFHSISHGHRQRNSFQQKAQKQYISPEHNEMIRYVQQSWKGVERDYKKSVNNFINNIDLNDSSSDPISSTRKQSNKKKTANSSPLLLSGSYHHISTVQKNSTTSGRQDSFKPFDLEAFWENRIFKRLTEEL